MSLLLPDVWSFATRHFALDPLSIHGPAHWRAVARNGLLIAKDSGANVTLVHLFAILHDCCRRNDGSDRGHGPRAAELVLEINPTLLHLDPADLQLLTEACRGHTSQLHHPDPTIGTCWDADRLDLPRVGMTPDEHYMSTSAGKALARERLPST